MPNETPKSKTILEELKYAREDLDDLQIYLEEFSSFLPLPVISVNPVGFILDVNKAFEDLAGVEKVEVLGNPVGRFFSEKKKFTDLQEKVLQDKIPEREEMTLIAKERKIPISLYLAPRKDKEGNAIGYFIGIYDITEFKELKEGLEKKVLQRTKGLEESRKALMNILEDVEADRKKIEKSRGALMNILEDVEAERKRTEEERDKTLAIITNFTDGLLVFNEENRLSLINPRAKDFFNVQSEEIEKIEGLTLLEIAKFPTLTSLVALLGKEIEKVFRKELSITENLILEVSSVQILRDGERLGTLVILHDITRERRIEKMKSEFVSIAAHQLRTPLSAIKWTLKILLDGDLGEITSEQRDFIEKTYQSNERMISLINDLLNVTRIEEGRYLYKLTLNDIETVINFVVNSCKEGIKRKKIKLEFKKPKERPPHVLMDVEKIKLAVQNLFDNAINYTPTGGSVVISFNANENEIEVSIKDSGIGIPKDQQERVFTKFFRAANAMKSETEGSGLGLFIVKNIIESHGGRIWFESEEGKGSTFYFTLPLRKDLR